MNVDSTKLCWLFVLFLVLFCAVLFVSWVCFVFLSLQGPFFLKRRTFLVEGSKKLFFLPKLGPERSGDFAETTWCNKCQVSPIESTYVTF